MKTHDEALRSAFCDLLGNCWPGEGPDKEALEVAIQTYLSEVGQEAWGVSFKEGEFEFVALEKAALEEEYHTHMWDRDCRVPVLIIPQPEAAVVETVDLGGFGTPGAPVKEISREEAAAVYPTTPSAGEDIEELVGRLASRDDDEDAFQASAHLARQDYEIERLRAEVERWKQPVDNTGDYVHPLWGEVHGRDARIKELEEALEPFVKEFEDRRDAYIRRYGVYPDIGAQNFDKMPHDWPMERSIFTMGDFRRARSTLRKETQG